MIKDLNESFPIWKALCSNAFEINAKYDTKNKCLIEPKIKASKFIFNNLDLPEKDILHAVETFHMAVEYNDYKYIEITGYDIKKYFNTDNIASGDYTINFSCMNNKLNLLKVYVDHARLACLIKHGKCYARCILWNDNHSTVYANNRTTELILANHLKKYKSLKNNKVEIKIGNYELFPKIDIIDNYDGVTINNYRKEKYKLNTTTGYPQRNELLSSTRNL